MDDHGVRTDAQKIAASLVAKIPEQEQQLIAAWAHQVIAIRNGDISVFRKGLRIAQVTKDMGITMPMLRYFGDEAKRVLWTDRGKPMRGVIGGAGVGLVASIGGPMAGVAALGGAVAVPLVLLGAGGGAVLAAFLDERARLKNDLD